jgi:uncharacterized protein YhaN
MRFLSLELLAYGPFNDTSLDLTGGNKGLHIIYGPNEAGKSAALRAITNLLYGFPSHSIDNFIHANEQLRIGARLLHSSGDEIQIIRRKGRKNTLLDTSGNALPDDILDKYLVGVPQDIFTNMFGMDHVFLVKGGKTIVSGGGDIGQSLFAAGTGIVDMRKIVETLESEKDELFKPTGKVPRLNKLIQKFNGLKNEIKGKSLASKEWSGHDQALRDAQKEKEVVEDELPKYLSKHSRSERFKIAIPKIGSLQKLRDELSKMGDLVILSNEFSNQRQEAQETLSHAQSYKLQMEKELNKINEDISKISPNKSLIKAREEIKELVSLSGSHKKAMLDLPKRKREYTLLLEEAKTTLSKLDPERSIDNIESLRLTDSQIVRIRELGRQRDPLEQRQRTSKKEESKMLSEIDSSREELDQLPQVIDYKKLELALAEVRKQGDLTGQLLKLKTKLSSRQKRAELNLKKLGLWEGTIEQLVELAAPLEETVAHFEKEFSGVDTLLKRIDEHIIEQKDRVLVLERQIETLKAGGTIPSEDELKLARKHRDEGWSLVKDAWLLGKTDAEQIRTYDPDAKDLAEAYEKSLRTADDVGDRLRSESERVAKLAGFMAQLKESEKRIADLNRELEAGKAERREVKIRWESLWTPMKIKPLTPKEMMGWLQKYKILMEEVKDFNELKVEFQGVKSLIEKHRTILDDCLEELNAPAEKQESLDGQMNRCEVFLEGIKKIQHKWEYLQDRIKDRQIQLSEAEQDLKQAEEDQAAWRKEWGEAVQRIGLDTDSLPKQADAVLDRIQELFKIIDKAQEMQRRIRAIESDAEKFEQAVSDCRKNLSPDLTKLPPDEAIAELHIRMERASTDSARLEELEKQRESKIESIEKEHATIEEVSAKLGEMCKVAGVKSHEELPEIERRSKEALDKRERIKQLENELTEHSAGVRLEDFINEASQVDFDSLPAEIEGLNNRIHLFEEKRSELDQTIGSESRALKSMGGGADAAELAEKSQGVLAELQDAVARYVCVQVASVVLRKEIEQYRKSNQGPILHRASEIFAQLTLNSFKGLISDFDQNDNPILIGIRPSNEKVAVEGMSDGTSDQLYLSLRLASLEQRLLHSEPMPLILDDLLINFDDERSSAALKVLEELSTKTQIIFFTHHKHLVELAKRNVKEAFLFNYYLEA